MKVFHLLQRAHSALFRAADQALKEQLGLTASQQGVLFILMQRDGAPITAIATALAMGKSSLTGLVDRMSKKGLVRRRRSAADARSFEVFLEAAGRDAGAAAIARVKRINAALIKPFSAEERAVIERFLRHIAEQAAPIVQAEARGAEARPTRAAPGNPAKPGRAAPQRAV